MLRSKLLVGLVVSSSVVLPAQAVTNSNFAEMGLALATIPFEIAANQQGLVDNKRNAALLHLTADSLSILNKAFYFYNSLMTGVNDGSLFDKRDLIINGALSLRDLTKWVQHFKEYRSIQNEMTAAAAAQEFAQQVTFDFDQFMASGVLIPKAKEIDKPKAKPVEAAKKLPVTKDVALPKTTAVELPKVEEEKASKLAQICQVALFPTLNGLTAFALACTQEGVTTLFGRRSRFIATAAHSFVRVMEEYKAADAESHIKKVLAAVLIANATLLLGEFYAASEKVAECKICFSDDQVGKKLQCGHSFCQGCLTHHIQGAIAGKNTAVLRCPHEGCKHIINESDVKAVTDEKIQKAYEDQVRLEFAMRQKGYRHCPTKNCNHYFIMSDKGAMDCPECKQRYCANCLKAPHGPGVDCRAEEDKANDEWKKKNTKVCAACKANIQKNDGCKHMTCKCGYQFCWACLARWNGNGRCCNVRYP